MAFRDFFTEKLDFPSSLSIVAAMAILTAV